MKTKRPDFRQDIQGLRAIAVLLVVLYHARFGWLHGGYIGVDVFFVISGFLITGLLLKELEKTNSVDLLSFYARRIRRLLPAAMVVLSATISAAYATYSPLELHDFSSSALATAAYVSNLWFAYVSTDYLAEGTTANPLLHTWSLSVEEQFYIIWPACLLFFARFGSAQSVRRRLVLGLALICMASLTAAILLTKYNQPWAFFGSPTRAWQFGLGGILALWNLKMPANHPILKWVLGTTGLSLILIAALYFTEQTSFPGTAALVPTLGATLFILAGQGREPAGVNRWIAIKPLSIIGDISYSLYLWHWPIFVFMTLAWGELDLIQKLIGLAAAIGLASVTYLLIENPIRFNRLLLSRAPASIALGILLSSSSVGYALAVREISESALNAESQRRYAAARSDIPGVYANGCHADFFKTKISECTFGDKASDFTVVLFGDSHAAQWFPALERIAQKEQWRLVSITKSACPSVSFKKYNDELGRHYTECDEWRDLARQRIIMERPKMVILANASKHVPSATDPTSDEQRAEWATAVRRTISDLQNLTPAIVLIRDTPWLPFDAPTCLSRVSSQDGGPPYECTFNPSSSDEAAVASIEAAVASGSRQTFIVDMTSAICQAAPCGVEHDGLVTYRDAHHLTASFSQHLADQLRESLQPAVGLAVKRSID